jgi:uncharacterized tellurite resistance protein B-like protein
MENQYVGVIRVWAAMAWADGEIHPREAGAMKRLISAAELNDAERDKALGFLEERVELETAQLASLSPEAREGIYRAAVRLAGIDKDLADNEITLLERLRDGLKLDQETAERIHTHVANSQ